MATDTAGFRRVLHEWARRQLEERSDHVGPFEVVAVRMSHEDAKQWSEITFEDALTEVTIQFRHDGRDCPDSRKRYYTGTGSILRGSILRERCEDTAWSPMESSSTVAMLNQLLAIADEES
jgi:hypothetical protein